MFAQEPEPTPFDLNFRMLGTHVRVHPFFWLMAAFLGWGNFEHGRLPAVAMWIVCVFVSVLLHEFGHVLVGRIFGSDARILLYSFGGLAIGSSNLRKRWQRVLVYLAGPAIQLLLAALIFMTFLFLRNPRGMSPTLLLALSMLLSINLLWPIFNLLPIFPLDGGQVAREVCEGVAPGRGTMFALGASTALCAAIAILILVASTGRVNVQLPIVGDSMFNMFNAMLFAMFAANSFQMMQYEQARRNWDDRFPWER